MNDIIAGDPAPTNPTAAIRTAMNARERLQVMIRTTHGSMTVWSGGEVRDALDAYRAEVLAERDAKLLCSALNLGEGADAFIADYDARKRAEVLTEAADLIEAQQHRLDDAENARFGHLDHESELQHIAVHAMGALLRRVAEGGAR